MADRIEAGRIAQVVEGEHMIAERQAGYFVFTCTQVKDAEDKPIIFNSYGHPKRCPGCRLMLKQQPEPEVESMWAEPHAHDELQAARERH